MLLQLTNPQRNRNSRIDWMRQVLSLKEKKCNKTLTRVCGDAFQNDCPHSYTDLAMRLVWTTDGATMSPSSRSKPVLEMNFSRDTFISAAHMASSFCSSRLQMTSLFAAIKVWCSPAAKEQTCRLAGMSRLASYSFSTARPCNLYFMKPSQSHGFTLPPWIRKIEAKGGWRSFLIIWSCSSSHHLSTSLELLTGTEPWIHIKLHFKKKLSSVWPLFLKNNVKVLSCLMGCVGTASWKQSWVLGSLCASRVFPGQKPLLLNRKLFSLKGESHLCG